MTPRHRKGWATLAALGITSLSAAWACGGTPSPADSTEASQTEIADRISAGAAPLLLDVRTPEEFTSGHVPGAVNIPHDQLPSRLGELSASRDDEVVVYCERGGRAAKATETLEAAGFTAIRHLTGDMSGWRDAGLPTEATSQRTSEAKR